jgi:hypothetical protein
MDKGGWCKAEGKFTEGEETTQPRVFLFIYFGVLFGFAGAGAKPEPHTC